MVVNMEQIAKATGFAVPAVLLTLPNPDNPPSAANWQRLNEVAREMYCLGKRIVNRLRTDKSHTLASSSGPFSVPSSREF
jgi:hypothetical protein